MNHSGNNTNSVEWGRKVLGGNWAKVAVWKFEHEIQWHKELQRVITGRGTQLAGTNNWLCN